MEQLQIQLSQLTPDTLVKAVFSRPRTGVEYHKCVILPVTIRGEKQYQIARYTQKQVFHENIPADRLWTAADAVFTSEFRQLDLLLTDCDYSFRETKRGDLLQQKRAAKREAAVGTHNREKKYPLPAGEIVPALVDLGVITAQGQVVHAMYDKYRQINRFLEMVEDVLPEKADHPLRIVDFGCGKSYLTFVLYHYLVKVRGLSADIYGLDLKADVVAYCNEVAQKYGYDDHLRFEVGDIAGYDRAGELDMMVSLHACDTATDAALSAALARKTKVILSVPCCQHELNAQFATDKLDALSSYGILQERFSALATDALRGCLLEAAGYRTQILEFIDLAHSPKNLLIRAKRGGVSKEKRIAALQKAKRLMEEFSFVPTLYRLFEQAGYFEGLQ